MEHDSKDPREHVREIGRSGDRVLMEEPDGKRRIVAIDKKGIKRGDYLQPNQSKQAFIETHGWHPQESNTDVQKYLLRKGLGGKYNPRDGQD